MPGNYVRNRTDNLSGMAYFAFGSRILRGSGRTKVANDRRPRFRVRTHDHEYPDWSSAAAFALTTMAARFPIQTAPMPPLALGALHSLEFALNIANAKLAHWDPFIHFFGLPNEAQLGYGLNAAGDGRGELAFCQIGRAHV